MCNRDFQYSDGVDQVRDYDDDINIEMFKSCHRSRVNSLPRPPVLLFLYSTPGLIIVATRVENFYVRVYAFLQHAKSGLRVISFLETKVHSVHPCLCRCRHRFSLFHLAAFSDSSLNDYERSIKSTKWIIIILKNDFYFEI